MAVEGRVKESMELIRDNAPRQYVQEYTKLKKNVCAIRADNEMGLCASREATDFKVPRGVGRWVAGLQSSKVLFLTGLTGTGKTEMIKALLCKEYGGASVLRVTDWNGLKRYDRDKHRAIILDDVNMSVRTREEILSLLDINNDSDVRVLYESVVVKRGTARVIITNKGESSYFGQGCESQTRAIKRRIHIVEVKGCLFSDETEKEVEA